MFGSFCATRVRMYDRMLASKAGREGGAREASRVRSLSSGLEEEEEGMARRGRSGLVNTCFVSDTR